MQGTNLKWLTSFGDLLTLLLCGFIMALTSSPSLNLAGLEKREIGTTLALPLSENLRQPELFVLDELTGSTTLLQVRLKRLLNSVPYKKDALRIVACHPGGLEDALERATFLERQLFDAGMSRSQAIELGLRPDCSALSAYRENAVIAVGY